MNVSEPRPDPAAASQDAGKSGDELRREDVLAPMLVLHHRRGEEQARLVQRALTSGDTVLRLLRNVLDASTIDAQAPRLNATSFALAPVVTSVLETFDPREIGEPPIYPPLPRSARRR